MVLWRNLAKTYLESLAVKATLDATTPANLGPSGPLPALVPDVPSTGAISTFAAVADGRPPYVPANHTESFEVTAPVELPPGVEPCVVDLGDHDFAFSYGRPWVTSYNPPTGCGASWSKVRFVWTAYVAGRQFDRVIHVWVDGAEIFRGISHEPSRAGIWWQADADVTSYTPLFRKSNLTVVAACDNIVDSTYTGIIKVNMKIEFYPATDKYKPDAETVPDVLVPLGAKKDSYGYVLLQGTGAAAEFSVSDLPKNIRKAELEYFVSNHATDEFYYLNTPDSYANPDNGIYGKGPFKELQAFVDGQLAGVDWPSPVVYTGGFNPLLWRPFVAIGASKMPTFKLDLTPYAGVLSDGKEHKLTLNVTNQSPNSLWYVDGILRLWLDSAEGQTTTFSKIEVDTGSVEVPSVKLDVNSANQDANITTSLTNRKVRIQSSVKLPSGKILNTKAESRLLNFDNYLQYTNGTNAIVGYHNLTVVKTSETAEVDPVTGVLSVSPLLAQRYSHRGIDFTFKMSYVPLTDDGSQYVVYTTLGQWWRQRDTRREGPRSSGNLQTLSVRNQNDGDGYFGTPGGLVKNHHKFDAQFLPQFEGSSGCYFREVNGFNRTVTSQRVKTTC
ncbi:hypothetical protein HDU96_009414 [Phlyctochytrium bullatum]|nr:hypothetical protein HDU96_009414 [Phlyctochytrium bullatum]